MKEILLKTATKKRYYLTFQRNISDHRENMWIERLVELLKLSKEESQYNYNATLEILAFQTACFMEKHTLDRSDNLVDTLQRTQPLILKDIILFDDPDYTIKGINTHLTDNEIIYFFSFYLNYNNTWENFPYSSSEEKKKILTYWKLFKDTFTLWLLARENDGNKNAFESDVRDFSIALYKQEYLPDAQKYIDHGEIPDDIVELFTSFKMDNTEIIEHSYEPPK